MNIKAETKTVVTHEIVAKLTPREAHLLRALLGNMSANDYRRFVRTSNAIEQKDFTDEDISNIMETLWGELRNATTGVPY